MLLTPYNFVFKQKISLNALYVVNGDSEAVNAQKHDFYCLFSRNGSCVVCDIFFGGWGVLRCWLGSIYMKGFLEKRGG